MTNKPQFVGEKVKLGSLIKPAKVECCGKQGYPILSITKDDGIVLQSTKFKKRIASKDTASYKVVPRGKLIQGIHIDEANFAIQNLVDWGIVSPAYKIWDIDTAIVDPEYLTLALRSEYSLAYYRRNLVGTVHRRGRMSNEVFYRLEVNLPSLQVQKRILTILGNAASQIAYAQQQIAQLDSLVKSRFVEMFERGQEWELRTLAECCATSNDIKCGPFGSQLHKEDYVSEGVPVWGIPEVNSNFKRMPDKYVSPENGLRLQSYSLVPGDVAMNRKGNVGQAALFDGKRPSGIIHSDVLRVRVDQDVLDPVFLVEQLHDSHVVREQVLSASTGAIMAGTNVTKLKKIKVFVPPLALQHEFAACVAQVDKSRFIAQQQIEKLQMLYDSLAQEYFGD